MPAGAAGSSSQLALAGPMWTGPLHSLEDLTAMQVGASGVWGGWAGDGWMALPAGEKVALHAATLVPSQQARLALHAVGG